MKQPPKSLNFHPPNWKELGDKGLQEQMSLCFLSELFFHVGLQVVAL